MEENMQPIDPKDLRAGDTVTILRWISHRDRSWVGDIINIRSVHHPFVFAEIMSGRKVQYRQTFDVREVEFATVSDSYIAEMTWVNSRL